MCPLSICFGLKGILSVLGIVAMGLLTYALFEVVRILVIARRMAQRVDAILDIRKWMDLLRYLPFFKRNS